MCWPFIGGFLGSNISERVKQAGFGQKKLTCDLVAIKVLWGALEQRSRKLAMNATVMNRECWWFLPSKPGEVMALEMVTHRILDLTLCSEYRRRKWVQCVIWRQKT